MPKAVFRLLRTYLVASGFILFCTGALKAQHLGSEEGITHLGVGFGLPYGGFGVKLGHNLAQSLTLFGGLGYNLDAAGFNAGLMYMFPSTKQTEFYISGMYGYNGVIIFEDYHKFNKTYYGPSFGAGFKINSRMNEGSFWDVSVVIPVRTEEFGQLAEDYLPFTISAGYNFMLSAPRPAKEHE